MRPGLPFNFAFVAPNPLVRIALRTIPVVPVAVWTIWLDPLRPFERRTPAIRIGARVAMLVLVTAVAIALLGIGLNWLYDPERVIGLAQRLLIDRLQ